MSRSVALLLPSIKKRLQRTKKASISSPIRLSVNGLCHHCTDIVRSDVSAYLTHFDKLAALKVSAATCTLCRLLVASFDGNDSGDDDFDRIMARMRQRTQIRELTGVERKDLADAEMRNVNLIVDNLYRRLSIEFTMESDCHDGCGHGKSIFGRKVGFCITQDTIPVSDIWTLDHESIIEITQRIPTVLGWISDCSSSHIQCRSPHEQAPQLPTRLLDVGDAQDNHVRLVESKGERGRYAALSHCWGRSQPSMTTKESLPHRLTGIKLQDLTKTIQHAILVTRLLGLRYIWIDSLCIVQDCPSDWQHEASCMANVYSNAHLTIAAASGSGSQDDLFLPPSSTTHIPLGNRAVLHARFERSFSEDVFHAPLSSRAWTLQEVILSRRIVYFANGQLYWECAAKKASEDGLLEDQYAGSNSWYSVPVMSTSLVSRKYVESGAELSDTLRTNWRAVAETYSRRQLTYQSDRLAALAGITQQMQIMLNDVPILGLWKNDLLDGLLWQRHQQVAKRIDKELLIPSWSWLSIDKGINYHTARSNETVTKTMQVLKADVRWTGAEHTSTLLKTTLQVRARLRGNCVLKHMGFNGNHKNKYRIRPVGSKGRYDSIGSCFLDVDSTPLDQPVWCTEVQYRDSHDGEDTMKQKVHTRQFDVLVLQLTDPENRTFSRVGLGDLGQVLSRPHSTSYNEEDPFEGFQATIFNIE